MPHKVQWSILPTKYASGNYIERNSLDDIHFRVFDPGIKPYTLKFSSLIVFVFVQVCIFFLPVSSSKHVQFLLFKDTHTFAHTDDGWVGENTKRSCWYFSNHLWLYLSFYTWQVRKRKRHYLLWLSCRWTDWWGWWREGCRCPAGSPTALPTLSALFRKRL